MNIFPLLAIPCFVIAGTLMEHGNITKQIIGVVKQLVGRLPGGLGITTILAAPSSPPFPAPARGPWRPSER